MRGSLRLGHISGIAIYIHWSFIFILVIVGLGWTLPVLRANGFNAEGLSKAMLPTAFGLLFVLGVFLCVLLHELGHAFAARRFNVSTRDITLLPIGGVARLERIPEKPTQEIVIALAGPLVNVIIAGLLYLVMQFVDVSKAQLPTVAGVPVALTIPGFLALLFMANVILIVFNLLPAFPMDGGRVLRAILAYRLDYPTATRIAAGVGQIMAVLFFVAGFFWTPWLMLIALFVYLGAQAEAQMAEVRGGLLGIPVRDAMVRHFATLSPEDTLGKASEALLAGTQQDFPVVANGNFLGILPRAYILKALATQGLDGRIADVMRRDCPMATEYDMLYRVFQMMQEADCPIVPVLRNGDIVGLVTLENVGELMMIRSALRQAPRPQGRPRIQPMPGT